LNGGGPWLQQQQQQTVMANGSARMLLHVPAPAHQRFRAGITADRPPNASRGKSA